MDPASKLEKLEAVKNAISHIKNSEQASPLIREFCDNVNLLVTDLQYDKFEKIQSWIQIYDVQSNMFILITTILHPSHLSPDEKNMYKNEIQSITDFIEYAREYSKKSEE
ncbi:MAG: hypothetical protein E7314_02160 [Clostridiales bacterium]|nr:hypothetical protein [Clostridiales bacterium]